jgi:hypothetical protein
MAAGEAGAASRSRDAAADRTRGLVELTMPVIEVNVAHGQTLDEAQRRLEMVVQEASNRFGLKRVEWSADRRQVKLEGLGARVDMWVDAHLVHVTGDLPGLGGLLSGPIGAGLKQLIQRTFRRQLP